MHAIAQVLSSFVVLILISVAIPVHACKLAAEAYDLEAFLAQKKPGQVVFLGTVTSAESLPASEYLLVDQKIEFEATRWWRGTPWKIISGRGRIAKPTGSSCDGAFDFSVEVGQQLLIVGNLDDGKVYPSPMLSHRLSNGEIPKEVLRILDTRT